MREDVLELSNFVMEEILKGDGELFQQLKKQYQVAKVINVNVDSVGFFVDFEVPLEFKTFEKDYSVGEIEAKIENLSEKMGFVLHVKGGLINCLEGYTYTKELPKVLKLVSLNKM